MSDAESQITLGGVGGSDEAEPTSPYGRRAIVRTMQSAVNRGLTVGQAGLARAIQFATDMLDDEASTDRDRLRASEFLASVAAKGIEVTMYLDKNERLDTGKATERVDHAVIVKGIDPDLL